MDWRDDAGGFLLVLSPGEEILASLAAFARQRDLPGGSVRALGAVNHAELGFFLPEEKRYARRTLRENLEVVSLLGNLAHTGDGPLVHCHAAFARADYSVVGGHLFTATVSVTLEAVVWPTQAPLRRSLDPRFDLKLLDLGCGAP